MAKSPKIIKASEMIKMRARLRLDLVTLWGCDNSTTTKYCKNSEIIDDRDFDKSYQEIYIKMALLNQLTGDCKRYEKMPREFIEVGGLLSVIRECKKREKRK